MSAWPGAHAGFGAVGAAPSGCPAGTAHLPLRPTPYTTVDITAVRELWDASAVHSVAFGLPRWRSLVGVATSGPFHRHGSAICSLTRVPNRCLVPLLGVAIVVLIGAPAASLTLADDVELGLSGRLLWLGTTFALALVGIVDVTRRLVLARRWRRTTGSTFELSNVASGNPGNGDASALLAGVAAEANERRRHLVLRAASANARAMALYRRQGFVEVDDLPSADQVRMERTADARLSAAATGARSRVAMPVTIGVAAVALSERTSPLLVASLALALGALGAAAVVDHRSLRLPNVVVGLAVVFGAVAADATNAGLWPLIGAALAAAPLLLVHLVDPRSLGFGDVKFAAASGVVVGAVAWQAAWVVPLVGFVIAAVRQIGGRTGRRAFGASLVLATSTALVAAAWLSTSGVAA